MNSCRVRGLEEVKELKKGRKCKKVKGWKSSNRWKKDEKVKRCRVRVLEEVKMAAHTFKEEQPWSKPTRFPTFCMYTLSMWSKRYEIQIQLKRILSPDFPAALHCSDRQSMYMLSDRRQCWTHPCCFYFCRVRNEGTGARDKSGTVCSRPEI